MGKTQAGTVQATFLLKRQAQADRAYNAALKSLTLIRQHLPSGSARRAPEAIAEGNAADGPADNPTTLSMCDVVQRRHA